MASRCIRADTSLKQKSLLALSYSILTPRGNPPEEASGRRVKHKKMQIGAFAAAQSHGANRVELVFVTLLTARTNGPEWVFSRRQFL